MPQEKIKLRSLRGLYNGLRDLLHGWSFYIPRSYKRTQDTSGYKTIAAFNTAIKERPELKEINLHRIENMHLAASILDGITLEPKMIFSLRKALGNPNKDDRFKSGPTLIKGRLKFSSGGGLCQVSTTLFNCALVSGLKIIEKHNHSVDIWQDKRMIGLGRDAVFAYYLRDLKFQNTLPFPVVLNLSADSKRMLFSCSVNSAEAYTPDISVSTEIIKKITLLSPKGPAELIPGWLVKTVRTEKRGGKEAKTYIHKDYYRPLAKIKGESL
ncbi:MAG TPA: VanW family protein [Candidatus Goldiibacteriota bacterium]|nr:VanW family protein [Candidatus Goldiibacteriota bacterium]